MLWPRRFANFPWTPCSQTRPKCELYLNYCFIKCVRSVTPEINFVSCPGEHCPLISLRSFSFPGNLQGSIISILTGGNTFTGKHNPPMSQACQERKHNGLWTWERSFHTENAGGHGKAEANRRAPMRSVAPRSPWYRRKLRWSAKLLPSDIQLMRLHSQKANPALLPSAVKALTTWQHCPGQAVQQRKAEMPPDMSKPYFEKLFNELSLRAGSCRQESATGNVTLPGCLVTATLALCLELHWIVLSKYLLVENEIKR